MYLCSSSRTNLQTRARMTLTWLWIFYRAKNDLVFVLGLQHPWDAHAHHDHGDHGHHEEDLSAAEWVREKPGDMPKLLKLSKEEEHH